MMKKLVGMVSLGLFMSLSLVSTQAKAATITGGCVTSSGELVCHFSAKCNDGTSHGPYSSMTQQEANNLCADHGGLAQIVSTGPYRPSAAVLSPPPASTTTKIAPVKK